MFVGLSLSLSLFIIYLLHSGFFFLSSFFALPIFVSDFAHILPVLSMTLLTFCQLLSVSLLTCYQFLSVTLLTTFYQILSVTLLTTTQLIFLSSHKLLHCWSVDSRPCESGDKHMSKWRPWVGIVVAAVTCALSIGHFSLLHLKTVFHPQTNRCIASWSKVYGLCWKSYSGLGLFVQPHGDWLFMCCFNI